MKVKTYGIYGLLEWHGIVEAGAIRMKVSFTNGTVTGYGVAPATFTTKDELTQFVIEHSEQYKSGRITLLRQNEVPDDAATKARKERMKAASEARKEAAAEPQPAVKDGCDDDNQGGGDDDAAKKIDEGAETGEGEKETEGEETEGDETEAETEAVADNKVKVADKREAIEWLKEHFPYKNYTATGLRTVAAFEAACKDCDVEFEFTA